MMKNKKGDFMKRFCFSVLTLSLLLAFAGCGKEAPVPGGAVRDMPSLPMVTQTSTEETQSAEEYVTFQLPNNVEIRNRQFFMDNKLIGGFIELDITEDQLYGDLTQLVRETIMPQIDDMEPTWEMGGSEEHAYYMVSLGDGSVQYDHYITKVDSMLCDVWFNDSADDALQEEILENMSQGLTTEDLKAYSKGLVEKMQKESAQRNDFTLEFKAHGGFTTEPISETDYQILKDGEVVGGCVQLDVSDELKAQKIAEATDAYAALVKDQVQSDIEAGEFTTTLQDAFPFQRIQFENETSVYYHYMVKNDKYRPIFDVWFDSSKISVEETEDIIMNRISVIGTPQK